VRVEVYSRGQLVSGDAEILGGEVTEKWVTGLRSTLSLTVDPSPEWLGWFKLPGLEVRPYSGIGWGSTETLLPLGVFPVLPPQLSLPRSAVSVQADDRWQGVDPLGDFGFTVPTTPYEGRIRDAIGTLVNEVAQDWAPPASITATSPAMLVPGLFDKSRGQVILALADSIGAEVFYDRDGLLVVQDRDAAPGVALSDGDNGTILTVTTTQDFSGVYNAVAVSGSNNDAQFPPVVVAITDRNHPAHRSNIGFQRVLKYSSPLLSNQAQAIDAGQTLLEKHAAAAMSWTVTCIPDARIKAGDVFPLTTVEWGTVMVTVQEVHHPLGEGVQTLTLGAV
jgi:hypothetical protein